MSTSSTTHEPDASDDLTDIEKQRPNTISTESLTKEEKFTSDSAVVVQVPAHDSIFDEEYPDGGFRAWLIVFGAMCNTFATFGYVNSWGIFQAYYQLTLLHDSPPSSIAWIGSIQYALIFLPAIFIGRLFDLGHFRVLFLSSSALLVGATFLVAQCTQYWHFLLCQGIAVGAACGGIFGPTAAVIAHWFKKRRGLAMGIVAVGSSLGGVVLPIVTKSLVPVVGFPWTMRVLGFILLVVLGAANLTLKRRLPSRNVPGGLFNWGAFKSAPFSVYCASAFFNFLGLYTVLTYVDVSAASIGISPSFSFYFVAIANAGSLLGRYVAGYMSDRLGPMNIMIPFTGVAGILTYAWPFAKTKASLLALTVLYGFASGSYISLLANPMMDLGDTHDVGRRLGMFLSIMSFGALAGPPISGAINTATGSFTAVGVYAGTMVMVGVGLIGVTRHLLLKQFLGKI